MSSRREAKRGFFSDDYALFSPCNFPIILGFFPLQCQKLVAISPSSIIFCHGNIPIDLLEASL